MFELELTTLTIHFCKLKLYTVAKHLRFKYNRVSKVTERDKLLYITSHWILIISVNFAKKPRSDKHCFFAKDYLSKNLCQRICAHTTRIFAKVALLPNVYSRAKLPKYYLSKHICLCKQASLSKFSMPNHLCWK